jgi:hypothetical protein
MDGQNGQSLGGDLTAGMNAVYSVRSNGKVHSDLGAETLRTDASLERESGGGGGHEL